MPTESEIKLNRIVLLAILGVVLVFYAATIRPGHRAGDFAMFMQHTINLVDGAPYASSPYVQNPAAPSIGTTSYPPGLPFLLAPSYALFGLNLTPMKLLMVLLFVAAMLVFGWMTASSLKPPWFAVMLLDVCFTPYLWAFKDNVESDFPFLLPLFVALFLVVRADSDEKLASNTWYCVAIGVMIYLAVAIRSIGMSALVALVLFDQVRRRKVTLTSLSATPVVTVALLFFMQSALLPAEGGSYVAAFLQEVDGPFELIASMIRNAKFYILAVAGRILLSNGHGTLWADGLLLLAIASFGYGLMRRIERRVTVMEVFLIVYIGILLIWPFRQPNYLIPIVPFLSYYAFVGLQDLAARFKPAARYAIVGGTVVMLAATFVPRYKTLSFDRIPHDIGSESSQEFYLHVQTNLPEDAFIVSRLPREIALLTKRRSTPPQHATDVERYTKAEIEEVLAYATEVGAGYIAAGPHGFEFHREILPLWNMVTEHPELFDPVFSNDEWHLVRLKAERMGILD